MQNDQLSEALATQNLNPNAVLDHRSLLLSVSKLVEKEHMFVGEPVPMIESSLVVTGKGSYPSDIHLPDMLYGKILRSPHPSAKILSIDTSRANKLPGVQCVIAAKDLPPARYGRRVQDRYVLARDFVRFVGDPVAAVAAKSPDMAQEAVNLIDVEYEPLPAIFDAEKAMESSSPLIHTDFEKYVSGWAPGGPTRVSFGTIGGMLRNVTNSMTVKCGDVKAAFEQSDIIVENRYTTAWAQHSAMDVHTAVARPDLDGGVTIWTESVLTHAVVAIVAMALQLPMSKIRISVPMVGGSFGSKNAMEIEAVCAALALKTSKPVKLSLTRKEEFATVAKHHYTIYIKDGVKRDGTIIARKMKSVLNGGAYASGNGYAVTRLTALGAIDAYRVPNVEIEAYRVYTNLPPAGPFRGFGTEVVWAIEQNTDVIARKLGMDPLEVRRKNLLRENDINAVGERVHELPLQECLASVAKEIGWDGPTARSVGDWRIAKGVAIGNRASYAPTTSNAVAKLLPDGSLNLDVSVVDSGQGIRTALRLIAAEVIRIPLDRITVTFPYTPFTPADEGAVSSRSTYNTGNAVRIACERIRDRLLESASIVLGTSKEELEIQNGVIAKRGAISKDKSISLQALFAYKPPAEGLFIGQATWTVKGSQMDSATSQPVGLEPGDEAVKVNSFITPIAQAVELAVNVNTGEIQILKIRSSCDVGKSINPNVVTAQLDGATTMGLSTTLFEETSFDEGRLLSSGFLDYKLPTILDIPSDMKDVVFETPVAEGPFGARGVGEAGFVGIGAAIGNAIFNATGVRIRDAPITQKKILEAIMESEGKIIPKAPKLKGRILSSRL